MSELALLGGPKAVVDSPRERWVRINDEVKSAVMALLDEGTISISGPTGVLGEFEEDFRQSVGTRHALAMNSGTNTLHSAYFALGVGPGDEVLVPPTRGTPPPRPSFTAARPRSSATSALSR